MANRARVMRWGFHVLPHAIIVRMFGVVDRTMGDMFEEATQRAMKLNKRQVVIDFSDAESVDALGLLFCGYGLHHFQQLCIPVALVRPPDDLLSILKMHGSPGIPPVFLEAKSVPNIN